MKKLLTFLFAMAAILTACNGKAQTTAQSEKEKVLVAYFSCTGHTERAAKAIAEKAGADIYRILPQKAYTAADLDWTDKTSRSSVEMNNPASRPQLADKKAPVAKYDVIFLGYPVWWGVCPRIINTFLESYDFKGKKVIPFVTSGSSGISQSETALHQTYPQINWGKGLRISGQNGQETEIENWIRQGLK